MFANIQNIQKQTQVTSDNDDTASQAESSISDEPELAVLRKGLHEVSDAIDNIRSSHGISGVKLASILAQMLISLTIVSASELIDKIITIDPKTAPIMVSVSKLYKLCRMTVSTVCGRQVLINHAEKFAVFRNLEAESALAQYLCLAFSAVTKRMTALTSTHKVESSTSIDVEQYHLDMTSEESYSEQCQKIKSDNKEAVLIDCGSVRLTSSILVEYMVGVMPTSKAIAVLCDLIDRAGLPASVKGGDGEEVKIDSIHVGTKVLVITEHYYDTDVGNCDEYHDLCAELPRDLAYDVPIASKSAAPIVSSSNSIFSSINAVNMGSATPYDQRTESPALSVLTKTVTSSADLLEYQNGLMMACEDNSGHHLGYSNRSTQAIPSATINSTRQKKLFGDIKNMILKTEGGVKLEDILSKFENQAASICKVLDPKIVIMRVLISRGTNIMTEGEPPNMIIKAKQAGA